MRHKLRQFVESVFLELTPLEPIVEIGSYQVQKDIADLRAIFQGREYIGCDMREGPGVDRIENVCRMGFPDSSIGTFLMIDVLEHVSNPLQAMAEVKRVLKKDGILVMSSVMDFPIHAYPDDFWRFTPSAFRVLTDGFEYRVIWSEGYSRQPETVIALCSKSALDDDLIEKIKSTYLQRQKTPKGAIQRLLVQILWGIRRWRFNNEFRREY